MLPEVQQPRFKLVKHGYIMKKVFSLKIVADAEEFVFKEKIQKS